MTCFVCSTKPAVYKCPTCKIRYCSIDCWTSHKLEPCDKPEEPLVDSESSITRYSFNTADTVPIEKLKLLKHHEGVRNTLSNPHVRSILNIINKAKNPSAALKIAMLEPIFVEFVEECLKVVEPVETN